jgi:hypothetical protein
MYAATKANVRTATAAQKDGSSSSFISFILWWLNNGPMCCVFRSNRSRWLILSFIFQLESILINLKVLRWEHLL